jgi:long-chain fatty acid transport protein
MKLKKIAALIALAGLSSLAFATDGYLAHGYGMKGKGMGGVSTAMAQDSMGGANNPASMVWAGDRLDVGIDLFSPRRKIERRGSTPGFIAIDGKVDSDSTLFLVPEFGYNKMLGWDMSAGISVYGNGGMNTDYKGGQIGAASMCAAFNPGQPSYNMLCGTGDLGMNLIQLVIAPTFAMKVNKNHSFGVSLLLGYQKFAAKGLHGFYGFTPAPFTPLATKNHLTNRGYDDSFGYGLKLGWMGQLSETVTMGASYATKMKMDKFDKYKDLFADQGAFDIPEVFSLGISFKATKDLTIAADYQYIGYSGIDSVNNPSTNTGNSVAGTGFTIGSLGCNNCRGFGWDSVNVFKLGSQYQLSPNLVLRAGYNHTDNPIQSRDVTFNMIAPGVVKDHVTAGFTYGIGKDSELTMAYMHAFTNSVKGPSLFNTWSAPMSAGNEKIQMYEDSLGIAYGVKF